MSKLDSIKTLEFELVQDLWSESSAFLCSEQMLKEVLMTNPYNIGNISKQYS